MVWCGVRGVGGILTGVWLSRGVLWHADAVSNLL